MNGISRPRRYSALRRRVALGVSAVMVGTLLQAIVTPTATAEPTGNSRPDLPSAENPVKGRDGVKAEPRKLAKGPKAPTEKPKAKWPKAGSAVVTVPAASSKAADAPTPRKAKGLPLALGAPEDVKAAKTPVRGKVSARVLGRKAAERAGVNGVLFALEPGERKGDKPGRAQAMVDYSSFAEAFGGGYARRLTLVELPGCVLDEPSKPECRTSEPVPTVNDTEKQTLTTDGVALRASAPTVLAAVAAEEGENSDYTATSLSPSATWNTNLNTGDFAWSYDIPVPGVPGGLQPNVGLSYSSGAIDGRTGTTNNQSSWVGDGFDLWPGYIERRYKPCADDGEESADGNKPGDLCWDYDNAFITFNGKGGELVPAGGDEFKFQQDDGSRIKRLKSTNRGNGDNNGEYWRLTDPNGVRYYFGYNRLPGWADGKATTNSTWAVPVFGNNSGEPCHATSGFKDSWCQQAWRWNLDYVVDPRANAVAYYYDQEKNSYGRNLEAKDNTRYTRGGSLDRIEYGLKSSSMYGTKPLAKVDFTTAERCLPNASTDCTSIENDAFYWYDTPWDLNCKATEDCDQGRMSPVFFTSKRLTGVTTQVRDGDTYAKVDSFKLGHRWGQADIDYQLLLDSVQRTGHTAEPTVTLPKTTFAYTQLANRLDKTGDGYAPFIKARLSTIADESGGQVDVNYSPPACTWDALPAPESNTTRCFPQYIGGSDTADKERQWFNKYVVTSTVTTDRTGGAPDNKTVYEYKGGAAWHYDDDDGLTKEKFKTWSQWRGYGHVRVKTGGQGGATALKSQQDSYFLRGMHGDRKDTSGGTKTVTVSLDAAEGDPITDHESAAGFTYRTVSFDKPDGKVLGKTVSRPWYHETGKKVRDWGTLTANLTGTSHSKSWTSLDNGAGTNWRVTSTSTKYDTVAGRVIQVDDFADNTTSADNRCTRTTYATNTTKNILTLPSRVETVAVRCSVTPDRSKHVLSDVRTAYDGAAYNVAPTKGDATAAATLKKHDGTTGTYLESGATFDGYGRTLTTTDLTANVTATNTGTPVRTARTDGRTATTAYSPKTGFPTELTEATPPAKAGDSTTAQTTVTELDPLRGQPTVTVDSNSKRTTFTYDALGRSDKVWLADRRTSQTPSYQFTYYVNEGEPVSVRTQTLNNTGGQLASYTLYDGFLRERQSQSPGPDGGRLLTDVFYDERGQVTKTFAPYYTQGAPSRSLFTPADALSVESQTRTSYDGLGRPVEEKLIAGNGDGGTVLGVTRTVHGGDRTTVIPPEGGIATTTLVDARGQTTEVRQHHSRNVTAAFDTVKRAYTPRGELAKVTDQEGSAWTYAYDQLGRQTKATDPDKGTTTSTYDDRSQVLTTTDARGITLASVYDDLGRQTELRRDSKTGPLRAKWVYDTITGAKGQLAEATRYDGGNAYTSKVTQYDRLYRPVKTAVVIPEAEGALAGTYQTGTAYRTSGLVGAVSYSAAGSLPGGSYNYSYEDETLRPTAVFGGGIRADVTHSLTGKPLQYELGATDGKKTWATNTYEWGTQRLKTARVDRQDQAGVDQYATYGYDQVGNILSASDVSRSGTDTQCFTYDHLRRLSEAWTQGSKTCAATGSTATIDGPAPYHHSYTYDKVGNRLTETLHDTSGDTTKNVRRTYAYPGSGQAQPHTLTSVTSQLPGGTSTRDSYTYDKAGNTTARTLNGTTQTLAWDAEGHLAKATQPVESKPDKITEYLYDAEGNRLIGRTPTETTLYLGHTEVVLPKGATKAKATRYTPLGGGHQAIKADDGTVSFTTADPNGTGQLAITATDLALTQRRTLPFGAPRGETPEAWPGTKGFIGGTDDTASTGLTHLGAREYDPTTARFLSVDPLLELDHSQTLNGYTYAAQNPLTYTDPTGLGLACGGRGGAMEGCGSGVVTDSSGARSSKGRAHGGNEPGYSKAVVKMQATTAIIRAANRAQAAATQAAGAEARKQYRCGGGCSQSGYGPSVDRHLDSKMTYYEPTPDLFDLLNKHVKPFVVDTEAWKGCFGEGDLSDCGWAALDLPTPAKGAKALKLGKGADKAKKGKKSGGCMCFLAGTDVLLADGTTKNIEDIELGDTVLATDPETGETSERDVTATIVTNDDKYFTDLTITTPDGPESLVATHEHPFWAVSEQDWIEAGDLQPGMTLRTDDGHTVTVTATRQYKDDQRTYNLTIEGVHTYYVLAGETPVLVHNSNCGPGTKFDVPTGPGIYTIHLNDGTKYVGSSTSSIRERVNKSMRSKHAVRKAGYTSDDVVNVTYFTLPAGTSKTAIRRMEQTMMEGVKARGGTLLNRRDPEIEVPSGGYLP
ncbi:polymorphic toxin-type HINT domain-containing protein [Streptomyces apocyni]|uniref:polymorphic toxin-type HINT domain-containing protein n=1 Tax=Streptomyces apocyni TaxID=2654677 RepID=UPI001E2D89DE|nr:polymorphic toxin-type HINT domain-containing protein [Streptomyces apocyni]